MSTTPIFNQLESKGSEMAMDTERSQAARGASSSLDDLKAKLDAILESLDSEIKRLENAIQFVLSDSDESNKPMDSEPTMVRSPVESYVNGLTEEVARLSRRVQSITNRVTL